MDDGCTFDSVITSVAANCVYDAGPNQVPCCVAQRSTTCEYKSTAGLGYEACDTPINKKYPFLTKDMNKWTVDVQEQAIRAMIDGFTGDDDETAILKLWKCISEENRATLVNRGLDYALFESNFDGKEWTEMKPCLKFDTSIAATDDDYSRQWLFSSTCDTIANTASAANGVTKLAKLVEAMVNGATLSEDETAIVRIFTCLAEAGKCYELGQLLSEKGARLIDDDVYNDIDNKNARKRMDEAFTKCKLVAGTTRPEEFGGTRGGPAAALKWLKDNTCKCEDLDPDPPEFYTCTITLYPEEQYGGAALGTFTVNSKANPDGKSFHWCGNDPREDTKSWKVDGKCAKIEIFDEDKSSGHSRRNTESVQDVDTAEPGCVTRGLKGYGDNDRYGWHHKSTPGLKWDLEEDVGGVYLKAETPPRKVPPHDAPNCVTGQMAYDLSLMEYSEIVHLLRLALLNADPAGATITECNTGDGAKATALEVFDWVGTCVGKDTISRIARNVGDKGIPYSYIDDQLCVDPRHVGKFKSEDLSKLVQRLPVPVHCYKFAGIDLRRSHGSDCDDTNFWTTCSSDNDCKCVSGDCTDTYENKQVFQSDDGNTLRCRCNTHLFNECGCYQALENDEICYNDDPSNMD